MTPHDEQASPAVLAGDLQAVLMHLRRKLRTQGPTNDLPEAQRGVLRQLRRNGALTVSELARLEGVRPQSMSAIVRALEDQSLLSRTPDERDGRQSLIRLTAQGETIIQDSLRARENWLQQAIEGQLSPDEQLQLQLVLPLLERLLKP